MAPGFESNEVVFFKKTKIRKYKKTPLRSGIVVAG
jgi:hypothetical protein